MIDPPADVPIIPTRRRILPIERLAAALEILLCSGFPTQLLLIGILIAAGMQMRNEAGRLSAPFVLLLSMLDTALVVGLVVGLLRVRGESARQVLIGQRPPFREAMIGIGLLPMIFMWVLIIMMIILAFAPELRNVPRNPFEDLLQTREEAIVFAIVAMIAGGVREEVQRGFILHRFDQYLGGAGVGVVVFSLLFGLGHIDQGYDAMIATGLLGAFWGLVYVIRRSIVAPMVSHAGFNLAQLIKYVVLTH